MAASDRNLRRLVETVLGRYQDVDSRTEQLEDAERTTVVIRHSLGSRLSHWGQLLFMLVVLLTGGAFYFHTYGPLSIGIWDGYFVAFNLHIWAGFLLLAFAILLFPVFHTHIDDHRQLAEYEDVTLAFHLALAFIGLRDYPEQYHEARRAWDRGRRDWMSGHPAQKGFYWWISIFIILISLTGFGMYREMIAAPPGWLETLGFLAGWFTLEGLRLLHLVLTGIIVAMLLIHVWFSALPSNWDFLKSMVTGRIRAYTVESEPKEKEGFDPLGPLR